MNPLKLAGKNFAEPVVLVRSDHLIKGRVVTKAGEPPADIQVEINGSQTGHQTTKTDEKGRFRFKVVRGAHPLIYMRNDAGESVGARDAREGNDDLELIYDPAALIK